MFKKLLLILSPLALAGFLSACGGGSDASFNNADVEFAQGMIPHHQQAVEMATLALANGQSPQVLDLAKRIQQAQDPEIATMQGWLKDWGKKEVGTDMAGMDMAGMMSDEEMAGLDAATSAEFDQMFLTMMIRHHEGAIEMAGTQLKDGKSAEAKDLAQAITTAQKAEIEEMKTLQTSGT